MKQKLKALILAAACLVILAGCAAAPFRGENGLSDGIYSIDVSLEGGTGKAGIESPTELIVSGGNLALVVQWSSPYYDYMKDGEKIYYPLNEDGNSRFIIMLPSLDEPFNIIADTTAMSTPHEIEYTITPDASSVKSSDGGGVWEEDGVSEVDITRDDASITDDDGNGESVNITQNNTSATNTDDGSTQVNITQPPTKNSNSSTDSFTQYAEYYSVEPYSEGTRLITINESDKYLLVEEGAAVPPGLDKGIVVLQKPFKSIYLAASAPMDFFDKLGSLDLVKMTSTQASNWNLGDVKAKVQSGEIAYVGKYSTPDFEAVIGNGCDLCVESTMIYHKPETKEKLEGMGVPVMVDYSSYEGEPLGRLEWIKLYGLLMDKEEEAREFFDEQIASLNSILDGKKYGKTVAYFYVTGNGRVSVKKSNDYVVRMIEMAGGDYVFINLVGDGDSAQSTVNMTMEEFYASARDADILIYNSAIDAPLNSLKDLEDKSPLFASFKAVKDGAVWCTEKDMYQEITGVTGTIGDLHSIISGEASGKDALQYMHRLK